MTQAVSAFQRNKKLYLEHEESLEQLVCSKDFQTQFQAWMDATLAALDAQYEGCEQRLGELQHTVAVDEGSYWNSRTLLQHCNLVISEKRLIKKGEPLMSHPSWQSLIQLISVLHSLKTKGFITPKQVKFLEKVEEDIQECVFDPHEIKVIAEALTTKLGDEAESQAVVSDLSRFQTAVDDVEPDLDSSEQLLEAALLNGDMAVAEMVSYRQLEMHEHVLKLIQQQYPILSRRHAESQDYARRRRWAITRMTNRDISGVIEGKLRVIDACEEDVFRLKEQLDNYAADDSAQRKRYDLDKTESDRYLEGNKERQQSVWNEIHQLFTQLGTFQEELNDLAQQRRKEVDRRLRMEEREASRRSGHQSFLKVATAHMEKLQDTIANSNACLELGKALHDFVLDGSETVSAKFDRRQRQLDDILHVVQNNHFKRFTDLYLAGGRLLYRKERKMKHINDSIDEAHIKLEMAQETLDLNAKGHADKKKELMQQKRDLAEEIVALDHRLKKAEEQVAGVLRSFDYRGVQYVHPSAILAKVNTDRLDRMLDYRSVLQPQLNDQEVILREEESKLLDHRRLTMDQQEAKKQAKLLKPKPPIVGGSTDNAKQYQRFQEILEKKLALPAPPENDNVAASVSSPNAVVAAGGYTPAGKKTAPQSALPQTPKEQEPAPPSSAPVLTPSPPPKKQTHPPPVVTAGAICQALYSYVATQADELSFGIGDRIICVGAAPEEGWFSGISNQRTGLFPSNYVTVVTDDG